MMLRFPVTLAVFVIATACGSDRPPLIVDAGPTRIDVPRPDTGPVTRPFNCPIGFEEQCDGESRAQRTLLRVSADAFRGSAQRILNHTTPNTFVSRAEELGRYRAQSTYTFLEFQSLERYVNAIANEVAGGDSVLGCEPTDNECVEALMTTVAGQLFRRPLHEDEDTAIRTLVSSPGAELEGRALVLRVLLLAADTHYLLERGSEHGNLCSSARPEELTARLTLALWNEFPDQEQLTAAAEGDLDTFEGLEAAVAQILTDPRIAQGAMRFHRHWLRLNPEGDSAEDMLQETELFLGEVMRNPDATYEDLLLAPFTYVNEDLANLYGLAPPESGFARVDLDPAQRAGLLTQGSFLSSNPHSSQRGATISREVLCGPELPVPPGASDGFVPDPERTRRESLTDAVLSRAPCANCHHIIEGIGFAFENFDQQGAYRETENGHSVNATWETEGDIGQGVIEFLESTTRNENALLCYARRWEEYLLKTVEARAPREGAPGAAAPLVPPPTPCRPSDASQEFAFSRHLHSMLTAISLSEEMNTIRTGLSVASLGPLRFPDSVPIGATEEETEMNVTEVVLRVVADRSADIVVALDHLDAELTMTTHRDTVETLSDRLRAP